MEVRLEFCRGVATGPRAELGLVGVQLFFDEGFDDRLQDFVRDLLHHVGTHLLQDPRDQGFDVCLFWFRLRCGREHWPFCNRWLSNGRFFYRCRSGPAWLWRFVDGHFLSLVGLGFADHWICVGFDRLRRHF